MLDPFSGTGTTAIAAKRLGRQYIGIELHSEYAKILQQKLETETPNSKISDIWSNHGNRNNRYAPKKSNLQDLPIFAGNVQSE